MYYNTDGMLLYCACVTNNDNKVSLTHNAHGRSRCFEIYFVKLFQLFGSGVFVAIYLINFHFTVCTIWCITYVVDNKALFLKTVGNFLSNTGGTTTVEYYDMWLFFHIRF